MSVAVEGISKRFVRGGLAILNDVSFQADDAELLVIVGPSGSGKSTLLRCIAGLEKPDAGSVIVDGHDVTDLDPGRRDVAMVFQEGALYPHLDVATNIAFPLLARKVPKDEISGSVHDVARMLDLTAVLERRPGQLSGGERRRVSLARAVIRRPAAFLMDEPLSSLDLSLKLRVQEEIRSLQKSVNITTIYVTHDQVEAMTLGHRIAVLRHGMIEQVGSPLDLYDRPANVFVATFLGRTPMNLFPGEMLGGAAATLGVRPEHLVTVPKAEARLSGIVRVIDQLGADVLAEVQVDELRVFVQLPRADAPSVGDDVGLSFEERHAYHFDADARRIDG